MDERSGDVPAGETASPSRVEVFTRADLARHPHWDRAFADQRKDRRYYEIVEDTICPEFRYRYFALADARGTVQAVQPFFILDQDIVAGTGPRTRAVIDRVRRLWPRFLRLRTLMVGCAAGEGHLDADGHAHRRNAQVLASAIVRHARDQRARLIVFKEFPAKYRDTLACFLRHGFVRIPSLPMTKLDIEYASFDEYMTTALNSATRRKLRKKFAATAQGPAIEMSVVCDASPIVDELHPLYLQVYERSKLRFEKLTKEYLCRVGRTMPDKVRFFVWRREGRIVAFSLCMIHGDAIYAEYIGLDYRVALDLHLYHYLVRDLVTWGIANGCKWFRSSGLNYDPKLHLRHVLDPVDLYVRHTSAIVNAVLKLVLPLIEPTRHDKTLRKFANYHELWARS